MVDVIDSDTTLTVRAPNDPNDPNDYATLADALDSLADKWITEDATVTIEIAAGTYTSTSPIVWSHPCGGRIRIVGDADQTARHITAQVSVGGIQGGYSVVLTLDDVDDVEVGHWLLTTDTVGLGDHYAHRGVWKITAISGSNVTVVNTNRNATFPANAISSSTSFVIRTTLKFDNCDGFVVRQGTIGEIKDVVIAGNSDDYWVDDEGVSGSEKGTHGIVVGAQTVKLNGKPDNANPLGVSGAHVSLGRFVGVSGFDQQGIVVENGGTVWGDFSAACNNKRRGYYASTAAGIRAKHISACGNYLDGLITDLGGVIYASSESCASGNGWAGVSSNQNGMIVFNDGTVSGNGMNGVQARGGGSVHIISGRAVMNRTSGIEAQYNGTVYCDGATITGNDDHGIDAKYHSVFRAPSCTIENNSGYAIHANEGSLIYHPGATISGNISLHGGAMLHDGDNYRVSVIRGFDIRSENFDSHNAVRMVTTNAGDDAIIGHDTTATGVFTAKLHIRSGTSGIYTETDADTRLGRANNRWSEVFAGTATINTSDAREKVWRGVLTSQEIAVARRLAKLVGIYQWQAAVQAKGAERARLHSGVTAQDVVAAFAAEGLDATRYGIVCYDEWEDEYSEEIREDGAATGHKTLKTPAGNRWGVRYDELQMFVLAGFEARLAALEKA
jgi:hypothetical protein